MRESANLARSYGVQLHTHLAETRDEEAFCVATSGRRPVNYAADLGWLGDDVWFAHGVHISEDEIAIAFRNTDRNSPLPIKQYAPFIRHCAGSRLSGSERTGWYRG